MCEKKIHWTDLVPKHLQHQLKVLLVLNVANGYATLYDPRKGVIRKERGDLLTIKNSLARRGFLVREL